MLATVLETMVQDIDQHVLLLLHHVRILKHNKVIRDMLTRIYYTKIVWAITAKFFSIYKKIYPISTMHYETELALYVR